MIVRVRYAPSPTGYQHIGGVRTALFNYLYARAKGGQFVLRIEDTDRERFRQDALEDIYNTFDWLGFHWDEGPDVDGAYGPYLQSERIDLYQKQAAELLERGLAYRCYCSPERLETLKKEQKQQKLPQGYDRHCRNLTDKQLQAFEQQGLKVVVRFKVPLEGSTGFEDELLGYIERANRDINPDPVLLKSDGYPTYHLANVVDDHMMEITHILRAQEWLSSGPLHVLLYRACNWEVPKYCHLPMVLGQDGQKLSKRHGATRIVQFKEQGYLPEALINYIALLGWSFDDSREFFSLKELGELFSLNRLNKAPAVFDYKKLEWFNGMYIRKHSPEIMKDMLRPYVAELIGRTLTSIEEEVLSRAVPLIQERLTVLADTTELIGFLFQEVEEYPLELLVPKRLDRGKTIEVLEKVDMALEGFDRRSDEDNEKAFRALADQLQIKLGDLLMPLRVALTGSRVSPPLFGSMRILGFSKTRDRVSRALGLLKAVETE